ncbi:MAG: toxin-activating lysine-acyltransferase [Pseudomonadota bacterium]
MSTSSEAPAPTGAELRAIQDPNPFAALGRAVSFMMTMPAFGELKFGHWSRTLTGQINRKHYFLVMDGQQVVGFLGWAFVNEDKARAWSEGRSDISSKDSVDGDCIVLNAWAAKDDRAHRFIVKQLRKVGRNKKKLFGKRFYKDGRVRSLVLNVNEYVESHIAKDEDRL